MKETSVASDFSVKVCAFCILILALSLFNSLLFVGGEVQSDRAASFVRDGLGLDAPKAGEFAYGTNPNGTLIVINSTSYFFNSNNSKLDIICQYSSGGPGLFYVTLITNQASTTLPLCAQLSADPVERARDFLQRYQNWLQDSNLTQIIRTLSNVDASKNSSVAVDAWTLNIINSPYLTSFYWKYTINQTDHRGLGIAFVSKYVFFRDDRNLQLPPQEPPAMDLSSSTPYSYVGMENPEANATNIPLNTDIEVMTPRPAGIMELHLTPTVEVANFTSETRQYSGYYTFKLAQQLEPNTTYTATILLGQTGPAGLDEFPMSAVSWTFTTGNSTTTPSPSVSPSPTQQPTSSPIYQPTQGDYADLTVLYIFFSIITLTITIIGIGLLVYFKKRKR